MEEGEYIEQNQRVAKDKIDLEYQNINPNWGNNEVSKELRDKLSRYYTETQEDGNTKISKRSLWSLLGFFTRDMRLGNLSTFDNELNACRHYINLANDLLDSDLEEPFLVSLSRAACILETSQSKGGFLRRQLNTLRQEHYSENKEVPQKSFFGGGNKELI